jgi:hypothetical protein
LLFGSLPFLLLAWALDDESSTTIRKELATAR